MANTSEPWRREGDNSWGEFLDEINNILQEPPDDTDCEPIEPIQAPEECHRWSKQDIEEVHDKLNEMPGDCFTFEEIPDKWKISIIEDIENQLENAWCDCEEDDECLQPCSNAGSNQNIFLTSITVDENDCHDGNATGFTDIDKCKQTRDDFLDERDNVYLPKRDEYDEKYVEVCNLENALEVLQDELADLQAEEANIQEAKNQACNDDPQGAQCQTLTSQLAQKQQEISDKQDEIQQVQDQLAIETPLRDAAKAAYIASGQQLLLLHKENVIFYQIMGQETPCITLIEGQSFPPPILGCNEFPAECHGGTFRRAPTRCTVEWRIQSRQRQSKFTCSGAGPFLSPSGGGFSSWTTRVAGEWDVEGNLVPLSIGSSGSACGCSLLANFCFRISSGGSSTDACSLPACAGNKCFAGSGTTRTFEYRLQLDFPNDFNPFDCDGETGPCEEEGGGGGPQPPPG